LNVAVITDIHSTLPALEEVFEAIDAAGVEETWCLGDVVGYGAEPDACADLVRARCATCLAGNHDLAVLGALDISAFSETAAEAVEWTRGSADERTLEFLRDLQPDGARESVGLFHGSPRDPVWEYVLSTEQAEDCLDAQEARIALVGHSHVALFFTRAGESGEVRGAQTSDGALLEMGGGSWLVNPGSVGQPRDGDPRAAWLELDTDAETARFHRVPYDIDRAVAAISAAGLPKRLGDRLHVGT
jgi:diadenosine tetraphosphatase ApaH/serine/threonine PP2A family protein phosphatase